MCAQLLRARRQRSGNVHTRPPGMSCLTLTLARRVALAVIQRLETRVLEAELKRVRHRVHVELAEAALLCALRAYLQAAFNAVLLKGRNFALRACEFVTCSELAEDLLRFQKKTNKQNKQNLLEEGTQREKTSQLGFPNGTPSPKTSMQPVNFHHIYVDM